MFEDVAQMEKEIETFRKNVVASSELVEGINGLTEATRQHKETYSAATEDLIKKIDACIAEIKTDHEAALRTLSSNNDAALTALQKNMAAEVETRMSELQQIKSALENLQASYAERLQRNETTIREYESRFDNSVEQIKTDHEAALRALSDRIDSAMAEQHEKSTKDLADKMAEIEKIKASIEEYQAQAAKKADEQVQQLVEDCERLITEMKTELASQQSAHVEKLQHAEQTIGGYQTAAEEKYDEFVKRLESTNVDQIFKEVQDLKQSIQLKFMILMGGIGAAIVVSVIGLILK